jgi:hypothetical protein
VNHSNEDLQKQVLNENNNQWPYWQKRYLRIAFANCEYGNKVCLIIIFIVSHQRFSLLLCVELFFLHHINRSINLAPIQTASEIRGVKYFHYILWLCLNLQSALIFLFFFAKSWKSFHPFHKSRFYFCEKKNFYFFLICEK